MKKKVLYVIFSTAPSTVVRAENFKEILEQHGYEVDYYYDFPRALTKFIDNIKKYKFLFVFIAFLKLYRTIWKWFNRKNLFKKMDYFDGIIAIKYVRSRFLLKIKDVFKGKILYDFDDSVWLPSFIGQSEFEKILSNVDYVSCDNNYLKEKAHLHNANVFVLNGPSQVELFNDIENDNQQSKITIGWVGSPSTLFYLYAVYEALEQIGAEFPNVELTLLGSGYDHSKIPAFEKIKVNLIPDYDQGRMISEVKRFDIGIYPLFKNELSLGRGSLKATIYMSAKVPVVCSAIGGENENIIVHGQTGYLASNTEQWVQNLKKLILDRESRINFGLNGYNFVSEKYNLIKCFEQLELNFLSKI